MNDPRFIALAGLLSLAATATPEANAEVQSWAIDPDHTHILFKVDHLGFSATHGQFDRFEGVLTLDTDNPANSEVRVVIDSASIDTNLKARDDHLRSADFLNVAEYPEIVFESQEVNLNGDEKAEVRGILTLKGQRKPVTLTVRLNGQGTNAFTGTQTIGFSADTRFLRSDFGIDYGVPAIGDDVVLTIETEAVPAGSISSR